MQESILFHICQFNLMDHQVSFALDSFKKKMEFRRNHDLNLEMPGLFQRMLIPIPASKPTQNRAPGPWGGGHTVGGINKGHTCAQTHAQNSMLLICG